MRGLKIDSTSRIGLLEALLQPQTESKEGAVTSAVYGGFHEKG